MTVPDQICSALTLILPLNNPFSSRKSCLNRGETKMGSMEKGMTAPTASVSHESGEKTMPISRLIKSA